MNDKEFLIKYENLLNKGYCDCNEMNCIDNNSPRRILNIAFKQQKEIERLNNIINELENTIANFIENHTEGYLDWKYDREIYLAESNILQKLFDTYLDKLKELKNGDNNE